MCSPLLQLPKEIRLQILDHLFPNNHCYLQIHKHEIHLCRAYAHCEPLALLLTCRTLSEDVQEVLYDNTLFDVQLHLQHLPLQQHRAFWDSLKRHASCGDHSQDEKLEDRGSQPHQPQAELQTSLCCDGRAMLNVPLKVLSFLHRIKRLSLCVWIYQCGIKGDTIQQIDIFEKCLAREGEEEQRSLLEVIIRLKLRPRWMQRHLEPMCTGDIDLLVRRLAEIKCVNSIKWSVEKEVKSLISKDCWAETLEGRAIVVK